MRVNELLEIFDNWGMKFIINNSNLKPIYKGTVSDFWDSEDVLYKKQVDSFGFYDNELCIRIYGDEK